MSQYSISTIEYNELRLNSANQNEVLDECKPTEFSCSESPFISFALDKRVSEQFISSEFPAWEIWNHNPPNANDFRGEAYNSDDRLINNNGISTISFTASTQTQEAETKKCELLIENNKERYDQLHSLLRSSKKRFNIRIIKFKKGKKSRTSNPINIISRAFRENNSQCNATFKNSNLFIEPLTPTRKIRFQSIKEKICCSCKHSSCIKLYCDCFKNGLYCNGCDCLNCLNKLEFETLRKQSIDYLSEKRATSIYSKSKPSQTKQSKGCSCKNSSCKKNYCDCFLNNTRCTDKCRCSNCLNRNR